ncbi:helix-turn-helix domain-containing protein [Vagococcus intermedius]|uniref:AraC family transcriptional regulator n=1 Tax=Vagococcus intermedius TaxID=2991418 RepID=A0AAF0CW66_9ENTE|nr:AraC family transcriptional regulator [Vagococcus intermedius]WEG73984.1 AraC family transcriptional regulator [Vagococcus intermedius]WEG76064.1 AraC family transcriptional regulator [Vagococcus intermedius]
MEFKQIQYLIKELHQLRLHAVYPETELATLLSDNQYQPDSLKIIGDFYTEHQESLDPLFLEINHKMAFIMFPSTGCYYLLGPFTLSTQTSTLPYLKKASLRPLSELLYYLLFQKLGTTLRFEEDLGLKYSTVPNELRATSEQPLHQQTLETMMLRAIKDGQVAKVKELLLHNPLNKENDSIGLLSKKSLIRYYRNISITTVTLATRAAIQGGLFPEVAYSLSDRAIQTLEDAHFMTDLNKSMTEALIDLTRLVHQEKQLNISPLTNKAREYISNHLYEQTTRETVATFLAISPNHLDKIFKADLKISVARYIKQTKLQAACELIEQQQDSLSQISESLGFGSLNSFSKLFKQHYGYPPSQHLSHSQD